MLSDYAFMSFPVLKCWVPDLRDADQAVTENYINSASLRIRDFIGRNIIRKEYTEIHDCRNDIKLKNNEVVSITSVIYDACRDWDGETSTTLTAGDDYFWYEGSRIINILTWLTPLIYKSTMKVTYVAGKYPLIYQQSITPTEPYESEVWRNSETGVFKIYQSDAWVDIDEDYVVNDLYLNALAEIIVFYKQRILRSAVGARSTQGNASLSFYQQMELSLPQNVRDMLEGQSSLF
jgi:hypothetical protein